VGEAAANDFRFFRHDLEGSGVDVRFKLRTDDPDLHFALACHGFARSSQIGYGYQHWFATRLLLVETAY